MTEVGLRMRRARQLAVGRSQQWHAGFFSSHHPGKSKEHPPASTGPLIGVAFVAAVCMQCYDSFMVASLSAAAQQVGQPHWGNSGPHDAGSYCQWPHQTGFFHHQGSWDSEYGRFFLQWYSSVLLMHADQLLGRAKQVLGGCGVKLHARLPTLHWWYNQAAHAVSY